MSNRRKSLLWLLICVLITLLIIGMARPRRIQADVWPCVDARCLSGLQSDSQYWVVHTGTYARQCICWNGWPFYACWFCGGMTYAPRGLYIYGIYLFTDTRYWAQFVYAQGFGWISTEALYPVW